MNTRIESLASFLEENAKIIPGVSFEFLKKTQSIENKGKQIPIDISEGIQVAILTEIRGIYSEGILAEISGGISETIPVFFLNSLWKNNFGIEGTHNFLLSKWITVRISEGIRGRISERIPGKISEEVYGKSSRGIHGDISGRILRWIPEVNSREIP